MLEFALATQLDNTTLPRTTPSSGSSDSSDSFMRKRRVSTIGSILGSCDVRDPDASIPMEVKVLADGSDGQG